jgi:hypothetical protein
VIAPTLRITRHSRVRYISWLQGTVLQCDTRQTSPRLPCRDRLLEQLRSGLGLLLG